MQDFIPFFQGEKRFITEKLAEYFEHSGLESQIHYDESLDAYILSVPSDKLNEAKKLYQEFYFMERDRVEQEEKSQDFTKNYSDANIFTNTPLDDLNSADNVYDFTSYIKNNLNLAATDENDGFSDDADYTDNTDYPDKSLYTSQNNFTDGTDIDSKTDYEDITDMESLTDYSDQADYAELLDNIRQNSSLSDYSDGKKKNKALKDNPNKTMPYVDQTDIPDNDIQSNESDDVSNDEEKTSLRQFMTGSGNYMFKSEKYKDYMGSFYTFLILGIIGMVFVILNVAQFLNILNGLFPNIIMGAFFIFFIYQGISAGIKANKLKAEAKEEDQMTSKINEWLKNKITKEFLETINNDVSGEELDYIKKTEIIREMLLNEFGELNIDYVDRLIEEYYSKNFE